MVYILGVVLSKPTSLRLFCLLNALHTRTVFKSTEVRLHSFIKLTTYPGSLGKRQWTRQTQGTVSKTWFVYTKLKLKAVPELYSCGQCSTVKRELSRSRLESVRLVVAGRVSHGLSYPASSQATVATAPLCSQGSVCISPPRYTIWLQLLIYLPFPPVCEQLKLGSQETGLNHFGTQTPGPGQGLRRASW